jgi:hypothetical protein
MNTYQLTHRSRCPNGELMDAYQVTVRSPQTIMVEDLLATLNAAPATIYHEDLATYLRNSIGAEVTVEGWHHGVFISANRQ